MTQEAYVSFEIAKLLKEKGFDEPCMFYYTAKKTTGYRVPSENWNRGVYLSRPTHQMACAWLREVHNILIWFSPVIPVPISKDETVFYWEWKSKKKLHNYPHVKNRIKYKTYEEAVEAALKYSLENLI